MKNTLFGYNQAVAVELGLNIEDLCILRWFEDFINTGKMQVFEVDGEEYYWIKYDYIIKQLPIIADDKRKITKKLKRLIDLNLLEFNLLKDNGTFSLYKLNESNYIKLVPNSKEKTNAKNREPFTKNGERLAQKEVTPITKNGEPRLPNLVDPFTKNGEPNINLSNINLSNINLSNNSSIKNTSTQVGDIENFLNETISADKVREVVFNFIEHRREIKKPMNTNMIKLFVDKLNRYPDDDEKIELMNNAIINGWKDIYPRDDYSRNNKNKSTEQLPNTSYDIEEADKMWDTVPSFV